MDNLFLSIAHDYLHELKTYFQNLICRPYKNYAVIIFTNKPNLKAHKNGQLF